MWCQRGGRASGLVAGLHNPVLQFVVYALEPMSPHSFSAQSNKSGFTVRDEDESLSYLRAPFPPAAASDQRPNYCDPLSLLHSVLCKAKSLLTIYIKTLQITVC